MGKTLLAAPLLALALILLPLTAVYADTPSFSIPEAYPTKAGYYIGESVTIYVKLEWSDLAQNYTLDIDLYETVNGTKVLDLGSETIPGAGGPASGYKELTYSGLTGLTDEPGTREYEVRVVDTGSGLLVASKKLSITVAEASIALSVAWDDASGDRQIDVNEQVTLTCFITWAFVNASKTDSLYVAVDGGQEQLVDTVSITAGGGSAQKTWITAFDSSGVHTVKFTLKTAEGDVDAQKSVSLTVGRAAETAPAAKASILDLVKQNIYLIIIVLACVGAAVVVAKYR